MKNYLTLLMILFSFCLYGQTANDYFHNSSKLYINGNNQGAKDLLAQGIKKYPNDPKLNSLDQLIEEEEPPEDKENEEQQEQQDGDQNKDQQGDQSEEQENQDQEGEQDQDKEGENKEEKEQEGQENKEEGEQKEEQQPQSKEGEEGEENEKDQQNMPSPSDKLEEMNISEEKAKMILEALKNSEIQYIQQNRRKPTKRKDSDKPDW